MVEPVQELLGELVERADPAGDDQSAVAEVDVVESELADLLDVSGMDGDQGQRQAGRR